MSTSAQISYIKQMQAALAAFALLNLNGNLYKDDDNIQGELSYNLLLIY